MILLNSFLYELVKANFKFIFLYILFYFYQELKFK